MSVISVGGNREGCARPNVWPRIPVWYFRGRIQVPEALHNMSKQSRFLIILAVVGSLAIAGCHKEIRRKNSSSSPTPVPATFPSLPS